MNDKEFAAARHKDRVVGYRDVAPKGIGIHDLQKFLAAAVASHEAAVARGETGILGDDDPRTGVEAARMMPDCTYHAEPDVAQFTGDRWAFTFTYNQSYP